MKINERDVLNILKPQSGRLYEAPKPSAGSAASTKPSQTANDQIELGGQAGLVSQVLDAGSGGRSSRIEELRSLVQSGQYQVDTAALSQSIVSSAVDGY